MHLFRAVATAALSAALLASGAPAAAANAPAAIAPERTAALEAIVDRMLARKGIAMVKLSPDATKVAMLTWTASSRSAYSTHSEPAHTNTLLVMDLATQKVTPIVVPANDAGSGALQQASWFFWMSSDRLAVNIGTQCYVYTVDGQRDRLLGRSAVRVGPGDAGHDPFAIVGAQDLFEPNSMHRINLRTGTETSVPVGLPDVIVHTVWDPQGRLRAAETVETAWYKHGARVTSWYRHDDASPWKKVLETEALEDRWHIVSTPDDSDQVLITSREGRDTWGIFGYDVSTGKKTDLEVSHPTLDMAASFDDDHTDLVNAVTHGLKPSTIWFDDAWQKIQAAVDAALPGAINLLSGKPDGMVMIYSYSDRDPGRWLLLDRPHMKMRALGARFLKFDTQGTRPTETTTYRSFDGLEIPAYVTRPADGAGPRPMVVYIHGGPVERDRWGFNEEVQILAAAGYAVLQPQFRGSSGFGRKFEVAGYRQWGKSMQDDITAGVKEMIRRGVADPQRICIYGASYGGYAALWGLAKTPELYRCGASFAGVSDIAELFTDRSDTNLSKVGPDFMRFRIGDVDTMKADFDAVSPEQHADRIRVPVLLAHGEADWRVPMGHTQRMASALAAAHNPAEVHWYPHEGHGFAYQGDERDLQLSLLKFLDRNIGPSSPLASRWEPLAAPASAAASAPAQ
jgi:dipeptidyl aminopeptidase/acylaminoacyl peptidase